MDGRQVDTDTWTGSIGNASHPVTIGRDTYAGRDRYYANCFIDDLRITKGIALYTQNFVPPSQAVGASLSGANETNSTTDFTSLKLNLDSNFTDTGPSGHSMTANGNTQISTAQKKFGAGSALFDGNGDYLSTPASSDFAIGSGDFTVSLWYYPISEGPTNGAPHYSRVFNFGNYWNNTDAVVLMDRPVGGNGKFVWQAYSISTAYHMHSTTSVSNGQWYHLQVCRSGSTFYLFVDGNLEDTYTSSVAITTSANVAFHLAGAPGGSGAEWSNSYIDDVLVLKGYALNTSSFTPPTSPLTTTVSQTRNDLAVLYLPFDYGLGDQARGHAVTASGNAAVSATQVKFGAKSLALDGSGDYLSVSEVPALSQNPFTIQAFVYPSVVNTYQTLFDSRVNNSTNGGMTVQITNSAKIQVYAVTSSGTVNFTTSASLSANSWQHIALVRSGTGSNETQIFIDGVSAGTFTLAGNLSLSSFNIGKTFDNYYLNGFIDDYRITSFAEYSANFTPPTSALSSEVSGTTTDTRTFSSVWNLNSPEVTEAFKAGTWPTTINTQFTTLYLPFDSDTADASANSYSITNSNVTISTAFKPFGSGSASFNGTNSFLTVDSSQTAAQFAGQFTIEFHIYFNSLGSGYVGAVSAHSSSGWVLNFRNNQSRFYINNSNDYVSSTAPAIGQWHHVAVTRDASNAVRFFLNGTILFTNTYTGNMPANNNILVGATTATGQFVDGYMKDLMILDGFCHYSTNFTPPTTASEGGI